MGSNLTAPIDSALAARAGSGARLSAADLQTLAAVRDPLVIGMLADEAHRRLSGPVVTFGRVGVLSPGVVASDADSEAATEMRLTGEADSLAAAAEAVRGVAAAAGARLLSGFSLAWLADQAAREGVPLGDACRRLAEAGLGTVAEAPVDRLADAVAAVQAARDGGLVVNRLTVQAPQTADARVPLLMRVREVQDRIGGLMAFAPLPVEAPVTTPTTGYDDVRAVALARLALETVPHIQVDWARYGPKLAQVALTFGADDLDGVSPTGEGAEGRRRAPLEDVRRNIAAAGFEAVERDGRFGRIAG